MKPTNVYHRSPTAVWERKSDTGTGFPKYVVTVSDGNILIQGRGGKTDIPKDMVPWLIEALAAAKDWQGDE